MKLYSWNVNGLRAVLNKHALQDFLNEYRPDVLCLQEIKCKPTQIDFTPAGYKVFWHPAERPGYSGTMTMIRDDIAVTARPVDSPATDFAALADSEGRVLALEFPNFFLVNVYTPNSKPDLSRLKLRETSWDPNFRQFLKSLEQRKPVVTCGDFNAAHTEIDLARPKDNVRNAGFTIEERQGITNLLNDNFVDTFRFKNPDSRRYTWWSHWGHARERNVGWRIDYFFISKSLEKNLKSANIHESVLGSDHCPVSIELEF